MEPESPSFFPGGPRLDAIPSNAGGAFASAMPRCPTASRWITSQTEVRTMDSGMAPPKIGPKGVGASTAKCSAIRRPLTSPWA